MKHTLLFALALVFVACKEKIPGTLTANEQLNLFDKKGRSVRVAQGSYVGTLKLKQKKKAELVFKADGKKKIPLRIPEGVVLPKTNGALRLSAAEVGQPYDIAYTVETTTDRTAPQTIYETCYRSYSRPVRVCRAGGPVVCSGPPGRRRCRRPAPRCYTTYRSISVRGTRRVVVSYRGTTTKYDLSFFAQDGGQKAASFYGYKSDSDRVVEDYGVCNAPRPLPRGPYPYPY